MSYDEPNWGSDLKGPTEAPPDRTASLWAEAYRLCAAIRAIATIPNNTRVQDLCVARNYLDHQLSDLIVSLSTTYGNVWANYDKWQSDRIIFDAEAKIRAGVYDDVVTERASRNKGKSAASLTIRGGIIEQITFNLGTGLPDGVYMLETK